MNNVQILGRMANDVEVKYTPTQMAVARFSLAIDRGKKNGESLGADFIPCVAFGKTAESMEKFTGKGLRVGVQGHIQTGNYEKNGQKIYTVDVIVDRAEFIDWKTSEAMPNFEQITEDVPF